MTFQALMITGFVIVAAVWAYQNFLKPFLAKKKAEAAQAPAPVVNVAEREMEVTEFIPPPAKKSPRISPPPGQVKERFHDEKEAIVSLLTLREHLQRVDAPQAELDSLLGLAPKLLVKPKERVAPKEVEAS